MALPFLRHGGSSPLGVPESTPPLRTATGLSQQGKETDQEGSLGSQRAGKRQYGLSFFESTLPKLCRIVGESLGLGIGKFQFSSTTKGCVSLSRLFLSG